MMIGEINGQPGDGAVNRFNDMTSEDFMKIMFAELSSQSPLDPQDSKALLDQINTVRSIESNMKLMDQLGQLVSQNQFASAGTLIGKHIEGTDEEFRPVEGRVVAVRQEGDSIIAITEEGIRVPFPNITGIAEPTP